MVDTVCSWTPELPLNLVAILTAPLWQNSYVIFLSRFFHVQTFSPSGFTLFLCCQYNAAPSFIQEMMLNVDCGKMYILFYKFCSG